jgi:hypothetical protein
MDLFNKSSFLKKMKLIQDTDKLLEKIFDCNKRDAIQVLDCLDELERLVALHTNTQNASFLIISSDDSQESEQVEMAYGDSMSYRGFGLIQKHATPLLVSLLSKPPQGLEDEEAFLDRVSNLMAQICGRIGKKNQLFIK